MEIIAQYIVIILKIIIIGIAFYVASYIFGAAISKAYFMEFKKHMKEINNYGEEKKTDNEGQV
jgi:hypothetical protein